MPSAQPSSAPTPSPDDSGSIETPTSSAGPSTLPSSTPSQIPSSAPSTIDEDGSTLNPGDPSNTPTECDNTPIERGVDLSAWTTTDGNGNWEVAADNESVLQTVNGGPTFFCSDFDALGNDLSGIIRIETSSDDDFVGFALGYNPNDESNSNADFVLIDWKGGTQSFRFECESTLAPAGLAVTRVTGIPSQDELWSHVDQDPADCPASSGTVLELTRGTTFGDQGWTRNDDIEFRFVYTSTQLRVFVNGVLEADLTGSFPNGRFCYYNHSQSTVRYSGLTRQVFPCDAS